MSALKYLKPPHEMQADNFLSAFGMPREQVLGELKAYWQEKGELTHPVQIYNHVMANRVADGSINPERAAVLKAAFAQSFAPEHSTGYHAKHRQTLVDGLTALYIKEAEPRDPVFRIEGDIGNLAGLNNAMKAAAENLKQSDPAQFAALVREISGPYKIPENEQAEKLGRAMADRVLHAVCEITQRHFATVANVTAVRKGGDEISLTAMMKPGVKIEQMYETIDRTQKAVASFVMQAGLRLVAHTKHGRMSGIGIGLHMVDARKIPEEKLQYVLAEGISSSKAFYDQILHDPRRQPETAEVTTPDIPKVIAALSHRHLRQPDPASATITITKGSRSTPDELRRRKLESDVLKAAPGNPLEYGGAEYHAVNSTHALVRKFDYVTRMPMFEYMEGEQLPYFKQNFGERGQPKLVNVDFSNMGGGNALNDAVGDAMARSFTDTFVTALNKSGLSEYAFCVAVRPGGKFALLVPDTLPAEQLERFSSALKQGLAASLEQPLQVSGDAQQLKAAILDNIATSPKLQVIYGARGEGLFDDEGGIRMGRLASPKTGLKGVEVVMTAAEHAVTSDRSLGDQLRPLEAKANAMHDAINAVRQQASPALRVEPEPEAGPLGPQTARLQAPPGGLPGRSR